jgi:DNA-binding MarR family transcriptional regulator
MFNDDKFQWSVQHDPLVVPLFLNLERARKMAHHNARKVWDRHGLTPSEFDVLAVLRNVEAPHELTPGQIQDLVLLTSGGLTKVIHLLEEKGFVERFVARDDNRVKPVRLTATGVLCIGQAMQDLAEMTGAWIRSLLPEKDIQLATRMLRKIADQ